MIAKERMLSMASITQNKKDGKVISYKFKACIGRDEFGKQIFRCNPCKLGQISIYGRKKGKPKGRQRAIRGQSKGRQRATL